MRAELARTHLLYGEWLRRANRRVDARGELNIAHEMFDSMGMEGFAERTRRELLATGATVHKRTVETRDDLTAQETQIARLARDGLSNPEIGAQLFISARTVEWHLRQGVHEARHQLSQAASRGAFQGWPAGRGRLTAPPFLRRRSWKNNAAGRPPPLSRRLVAPP